MTGPGPSGATWSAQRWRSNGGQMKPEDYSRRPEEIGGWAVTIETYKLGDVYHCTIANADPGARVARADGPTKAEAERAARVKAERYLAQTRTFKV